MLKLAPGVQVAKLQPAMLVVLLVADDLYGEFHGSDCWVTSGTEGVHVPGSKHGLGQAVDLRIRDQARADWETIADRLHAALGGDGGSFKVALELIAPANLPSTAGWAPHIHVEVRS